MIHWLSLHLAVSTCHSLFFFFFWLNKILNLSFFYKRMYALSSEKINWKESSEGPRAHGKVEIVRGLWKPYFVLTINTCTHSSPWLVYFYLFSQKKKKLLILIFYFLIKETTVCCCPLFPILFFLFLFLIFSNPLCTCRYPLFPTLFKKKNF